MSDGRTIDLVGVRALVEASGHERARLLLIRESGHTGHREIDVQVAGAAWPFTWDEYGGHISFGPRLSPERPWSMYGHQFKLFASRLRLPDTVVAGMVGRRVTEVFDLPLFDERMEIVDVQLRGDVVDLHLSHTRRPLHEVLDHLIHLERP